MTNTEPVSWEEIEQFSIKHTDRLQSLVIDSNVSVDLFISFVNFHIRTDRILTEFTDKVIPQEFMELVKMVMGGVRTERASLLKK